MDNNSLIPKQMHVYEPQQLEEFFVGKGYKEFEDLLDTLMDRFEVPNGVYVPVYFKEQFEWYQKRYPNMYAIEQILMKECAYNYGDLILIHVSW